MPLYNEFNLYYGASPLTSNYSSPSYYSPLSYPPRSGFSGGKLGLLPPPRLLPSRIGYSPLLPTISETSSLSIGLPRRPMAPLSRLGSPRIIPSYLPPKPIRIDTADIDVSTPRISHEERAKERVREWELEDPDFRRKGTIKRGRTVVRLHTKRPKDNPAVQKRKPTPGERLMEKFLIKDKISEAAKEQRQKQEEQERLEQLKVEATKATSKIEEQPPVMLTENAALDILLSTQEEEDSHADEISQDDNNRETRNKTIKMKKDKPGKKKTKKHDCTRRKSEPIDILWMMDDDISFEKSPLQRRNTVKKLRRNSQDLIDLDAPSCPSSRRSSLDVDAAEVVPDKGDNTPEKKVTVKRKRGGKQKFITEVTVENAVTEGPILKSPVKFVVDDIQVEETPASPRAAAKKFRYEVIVEDVDDSHSKRKDNKVSGEKKVKKKVKGVQEKKQVPKSSNILDDKRIKSENLLEESIKDCKTSKAFQISQENTKDSKAVASQKTNESSFDVKQMQVNDKFPDKETLLEVKTDNQILPKTNKLKDNKLDHSVDRDEGYVSKRRRSSDPKLTKIKEKDVQVCVFVAEKKKSPIMTKIIPKMEEVKAGKRVIEKKKGARRQEDPSISPGSVASSPQDTEVNFWAFLNSLDNEYQPVTLKKALSLDIVSASDITQNDQKTSPSPAISSDNKFLVVDDKKEEKFISVPETVEKNQEDKSKEKHVLNQKPVPNWKIGKPTAPAMSSQNKFFEENDTKDEKSISVPETVEKNQEDKSKEKHVLKQKPVPKSKIGKPTAPAISSQNKLLEEDDKKEEKFVSVPVPETAEKKQEDKSKEKHTLNQKPVPKWKIGKPTEKKSTSKDEEAKLQEISLKSDQEQKSSSASKVEVNKKEMTSLPTTVAADAAKDLDKPPEEIPSKSKATESSQKNQKDSILEEHKPQSKINKSKELTETGSTDMKTALVSESTSTIPLKETIALPHRDVRTPEITDVPRAESNCDKNYCPANKAPSSKTLDDMKIVESESNSKSPGKKCAPKWQVRKPAETSTNQEQLKVKSSDTSKVLSKPKQNTSSAETSLNEKNVPETTLSGENQENLRPEMKVNALFPTEKSDSTETSKVQETRKLKGTEGNSTPKGKIVRPMEDSKKGKIHDTSVPQVKMSNKIPLDDTKNENEVKSDVISEDDFWGALTGAATVQEENVTDISLAVTPIASELPLSSKEENATLQASETPKPTEKKVPKAKVGKVTGLPKKLPTKEKQCNLLGEDNKKLSSDTELSLDEKVRESQSKPHDVSPVSATDSLILPDATAQNDQKVAVSQADASKGTDKIDTKLALSDLSSSPTQTVSKTMDESSLQPNTHKCIPKWKVGKPSDPTKKPEQKTTNDTTVIKTSKEVPVVDTTGSNIQINKKIDNSTNKEPASIIQTPSDDDFWGMLTGPPSAKTIKQDTSSSITTKLSVETVPKTKKVDTLESTPLEEKKIPKWKAKIPGEAPKPLKPDKKVVNNVSQLVSVVTENSALSKGADGKQVESEDKSKLPKSDTVVAEAIVPEAESKAILEKSQKESECTIQHPSNLKQKLAESKPALKLKQGSPQLAVTTGSNIEINKKDISTNKEPVSNIQTPTGDDFWGILTGPPSSETIKQDTSSSNTTKLSVETVPKATKVDTLESTPLEEKKVPKWKAKIAGEAPKPLKPDKKVVNNVRQLVSVVTENSALPKLADNKRVDSEDKPKLPRSDTVVAEAIVPEVESKIILEKSRKESDNGIQHPSNLKQKPAESKLGLKLKQGSPQLPVTIGSNIEINKKTDMSTNKEPAGIIETESDDDYWGMLTGPTTAETIKQDTSSSNTAKLSLETASKATKIDSLESTPLEEKKAPKWKVKIPGEAPKPLKPDKNVKNNVSQLVSGTAENSASSKLANGKLVESEDKPKLPKQGSAQLAKSDAANEKPKIVIVRKSAESKSSTGKKVEVTTDPSCSDAKEKEQPSKLSDDKTKILKPSFEMPLEQEKISESKQLDTEKKVTTPTLTDSHANNLKGIAKKVDDPKPAADKDKKVVQKPKPEERLGKTPLKLAVKKGANATKQPEYSTKKESEVSVKDNMPVSEPIACKEIEVSSEINKESAEKSVVQNTTDLKDKETAGKPKKIVKVKKGGKATTAPDTKEVVSSGESAHKDASSVCNNTETLGPELQTKPKTGEVLKSKDAEKNDTVSSATPAMKKIDATKETGSKSKSKVTGSETEASPKLLKPADEVHDTQNSSEVKDKTSGGKPKKIVKVKKVAKPTTASDVKVENNGLVSNEATAQKDVNSTESVVLQKDTESKPEGTIESKDTEKRVTVTDKCSTTSDNMEDKGGKEVEKKDEESGGDDGAASSGSTQRSSTSSDDSGFDSLPTSKPVPSSSSSEGRDPTSPAPSLASNPSLDPYDDGTESSRPGWHTPPAASLPRFRKYTVEDFQFLKVLGKGSFGKVLLAELRSTDRYYAVKCLKKDVVLEDDDVECTLIERKVLALGTKHPYLCHLFCTFQTESHLLFVMEYLNGGDLMFHIQQSGRFPEPRARFYAAEIVCGLKFLHKKGIVYRDLKLDNILLDFEGHVRIADFGMCKLQIFLERTADTFCGTPDYMAPEIIKGLKYNQCVDWWSFGVLLFEMLVGVSPFNGCDEDDLFWSICNEQPHYPRFLSREGNSILTMLLEKDASKRLGTPHSGTGDVSDHVFFRSIDWIALEHRELEAPFKPRVQHPLDVQYFDRAFTTEKAVLTPIDKGILQSMDQTQFQGFSYTNPNATD